MRRVHPSPRPIDFARLDLTPEEGFVLSRVEGATDIRELVALTGLPEAHIERIVDRLAALGALSAEHRNTEPPTRDEPAGATFEEQGASDALAPPGDDLVEEVEAPEAESPEEASRARNYRQLYEAVFASMSADERVVHASVAAGSELLALCLDPDPKVIYAVVHNMLAGIEHARAIALWHRTPQGLDHISREAARDRMVERRLLKNPQLSETTLARLLGPKRLVEVYKSSIDRDLPERTRQKARGVLRQRWSTSQPEERVELLLSTEARCLILLTGCTIDARSVQILCGRSSFTTMFVTNIGRFGAAPPALLAHLSKQTMVRRNPALRKLILAHKNLPGDAKRSLQGY